jgi:hypothetical protein
LCCFSDSSSCAIFIPSIHGLIIAIDINFPFPPGSSILIYYSAALFTFYSLHYILPSLSFCYYFHVTQPLKD